MSNDGREIDCKNLFSKFYVYNTNIILKNNISLCTTYTYMFYYITFVFWNARMDTNFTRGLLSCQKKILV